MNIFGEMNQLRKRPVAAQNGEAISIEQGNIRKKVHL